VNEISPEAVLVAEQAALAVHSAEVLIAFFQGEADNLHLSVCSSADPSNGA
jgi:hypothetical protein